MAQCISVSSSQACGEAFLQKSAKSIFVEFIGHQCVLTKNVSVKFIGHQHVFTKNVSVKFIGHLLNLACLYKECFC